MAAAECGQYEGPTPKPERKNRAIDPAAGCIKLGKAAEVGLQGGLFCSFASFSACVRAP